MTGDAKQEIRERVWTLLRDRGVARFPGAEGRIPNFTGAEAAADRLSSLAAWRDARTIKANPDSPQLPVRIAALEQGKEVYMAVPRLREERPFLFLDPGRIGVAPRAAASIRGSSRHGRPATIEDLPHLDLVVCGSVAVDRRGARIGKGGGYADLELALLIEAGKVDDETVIATTVHPLQVLADHLPETGHDFRVDRIVTPDRTITCRRSARPPGVIWTDLDEERIRSIPILAQTM